MRYEKAQDLGVIEVETSTDDLSLFRDRESVVSVVANACRHAIGRGVRSNVVARQSRLCETQAVDSLACAIEFQVAFRLSKQLGGNPLPTVLGTVIGPNLTTRPQGAPVLRVLHFVHEHILQVQLVRHK